MRFEETNPSVKYDNSGKAALSEIVTNIYVSWSHSCKRLDEEDPDVVESLNEKECLKSLVFYCKQKHSLEIEKLLMASSPDNFTFDFNEWSREVPASEAKLGVFYLLKNDPYLSQMDKHIIPLMLSLLNLSDKVVDANAITNNPLKLKVFRNLKAIQECNSSCFKQVHMPQKIPWTFLNTHTFM